MEKNKLISALQSLRVYVAHSNDFDKDPAEKGRCFEALTEVIGLLETSYDMLPVERVNYSNREEAVESAINFLRMLLSYHQRTSMTTNPNFLATTYERDFLTAIDCLEREKDRLS